LKQKIAVLLSTTVASLGLIACSTNPAKNQPAPQPKTTTSHAVVTKNGTAPPKTSSVKPTPKPPSNSPMPGDLLIADRGNSRLLIVTPAKQVIWSMVIGNGGGPHNANSLGADDAFFTPDGKHIIINEEDNHMLAIIDIATKKIVWTFGHGGTPGSAPGYLNTPDDAYQLPNGIVTTADIKNQRILFINQAGHVVKQYGTTGYRYHNPPYSFAAPNGDTPLKDGGTLVTEIGGSYADRLDANGHLVYSVHFRDVRYPSDTQMLPNGNLLVVDYSVPGRVEEVTPKGGIVWEYYKASGPGMLRNPSLGIFLPNGNIAVNDDYNDRIVVIDPHKNEIVWQYGHTGVPGTASNYLNVPDGMDFVTANVQVPQ